MNRTLSASGPAVPLFSGAPALETVRLSGREGVNSLFEYELLLKTPEGLNIGASHAIDFDLDNFVGREISCSIQLDGSGRFVPGAPGENRGPVGAGVRQINGLVTDPAFWGQDGRHVLYKFILRPWLHLATLSCDCKVFQNRTVVSILDELLVDYGFPVEKRLYERYPILDYQTQFNETDFAFFERLCQQWGISYHFEHSEGKHRLVLCDAMGAYGKNPSAAYHQVDYHPPGWKVDSEHLHSFAPAHQLVSGRYGTRDYDYTRPRADLGVTREEPRPTGHSEGEVYEWHASAGGSHYAQPRAGASEGGDPMEEGRQMALLRMQALRSPAVHAQASGNLRGMVPGCTFALRGHPREKANAEYLILETTFLVEDVSQDSQRREGEAAAQQQWRVQVDLRAHPARVPLRPAFTRTKPHTCGPQSALVVGPDDQNIWTDEFGRIKVQFPWDRLGQKNQHSSCWVRVSSPWAGNQLGSIQLPRVGQEVIVDFLGGNPDLPICMGRVHNQFNLPPWALPGQSALSGFRSRELTQGGGNSAGGRSNHLVFDDTEAKLQVQLKSDYQHSLLDLGYIDRIEGNTGRLDHRGEGFELRTDGHGAVRAQDGLIVSTDGRERARGHVKDVSETLQRLARAREQHERCFEAAASVRAQQAGDQDRVAKAIARQNEEIQGTQAPQGGQSSARFPELSQPHLLLSSPAGIETAAEGTTHIASGEHVALTSGGHTSISADQSLIAVALKAVKLFAQEQGMLLVAAKADIDLQALSNSIHLLAKLEITQTAERITIRAKEELRLEGGGSYQVLNADGITEGTRGAYVNHAGSHAFVAPHNVPTNLDLPTVDMKSQPGALLLKLSSHPQGGHVLAGEPYTLFRNGAEVGSGITDAHGQVLIKNHQTGVKDYEVRLTNGARFPLQVHDQLDDSPEQQLARRGFRASLNAQSRYQDYGIDARGNDA